MLTWQGLGSLTGLNVSRIRGRADSDLHLLTICLNFGNNNKKLNFSHQNASTMALLTVVFAYNRLLSTRANLKYRQFERMQSAMQLPYCSGLDERNREESRSC